MMRADLTCRHVLGGITWRAWLSYQYACALRCHDINMCLIGQMAVKVESQIFHVPCISQLRPAEANSDWWEASQHCWRAYRTAGR